MDIDDSKTDPDPRLDEMGDDTKMDEDPKPKHKSWKKKYRKMRMIYDAKVYDSEELHKQELKAIETAKRIAIENDRILDMLLDINSCPQIPPERRIAVDELSTDDAGNSPPTSKPNRPSKTLKEVEANAPHLKYQEATTAKMLDDIEHPSTLPNADVVARPPSYLTPDDIDNYLFEIDNRIGGPGAHMPTLAPLAHHGRRAPELAASVVAAAGGTPSSAAAGAAAASATTNGANGHAVSAAASSHLTGPSTAPASSSSSYHLRNPASVYNWLRKHCPQVFLQDGEKESKDDASNSHPHSADSKTPATKTKTPGGARGGTRAGKRSTKAAAAAAAAAARANSVDAEDDVEGTATPAPAAAAGAAATTTARGKRKRATNDEDPGYRPKGGISRPAKKKRKSEGPTHDTPTVKRPRKNKKELSEEIVRDADMDGDVYAVGDDE